MGDFIIKSLTADMSSKESEFKAEIERMFRGIQREHNKMQKDQEEIDLLKAETRAILANLESSLNHVAANR